LESENRRMQNAAPSSAAGLGRSFATQVMAGAGAVSAFGAKSRGAFRSTFVRRESEDGDFGEDADLDMIRAEISSLQDNLQVAADRLKEARVRAMQAQQAAAPLEEPCIVDQVQTSTEAVEIRRELGDSAGDIEDATLSLIARAVFQLVEQCPVCQETDDPMASDLMTIQAKQKDLERICDAVDKQQAQIGRLTLFVSAQQDREDHKEGRVLEVKLRDAEKQMGDLWRRLETSEGMTRQMYELRCHVQGVNERLQNRDMLIDKLLGEQQQQHARRADLLEHLNHMEEDLRAHAMNAEIREEVFVVHSVSAEGKGVASEQVETVGCIDVGAQTDPADFGVGVTEKLRAQVDTLLQKALLLERESAQEVQELRMLVREQKLASERTAVCPPGSEAPPMELPLADTVARDRDLIVDGGQARAEPPALELSAQSSGMLYVQKIAELEAQIKALEHDLDLLSESEQVLLADSTHKSDLMAYLMRRVGSADEKFKDGTEATWGDLLGSLWGWNPDPQVDMSEMEHTAQEAILDNVRLRNDLQTLANELQKVKSTQ